MTINFRYIMQPYFASHVSLDSGEDVISGRAFCKAYQHFFSWPTRGHCILCFLLLLFHPTTSGIFLYFLHQTHSPWSIFLSSLPQAPLLFHLPWGLIFTTVTAIHYILPSSHYAALTVSAVNDGKMHLFAEHLRHSHFRKVPFLPFILVELSLKHFSHPPESVREKSSSSLSVIIRSDKEYFGSVHAGHKKDKLPKIYHRTFQKKKKKRLSVAQCGDNKVSKQGQLEVIKLLANWEVSRN